MLRDQDEDEVSEGMLTDKAWLEKCGKLGDEQEESGTD